METSETTIYDKQQRPDAIGDGKVSRWIRLGVILMMLAIPARIISRGYLPEDDALRYAAKAVSGKPWKDILVLGNTYTVDHNFGWQALLRKIYVTTDCDTERLVDLSVLLLFALAGCAALPWLKRPEAWLGTLLVFSVGWPQLTSRLMIGRPLLLSMVMLMTVLFLWHARRSSQPGSWTTASIALFIGIAVFCHGVWYLWTLPVVAFLLAREFRWAICLGTGWLVGTLVAATLTGHPLAFLFEAVEMAVRAIGLHPTARTMVPELQPASGGLAFFLLLGALWVLRQITGLRARPFTSSPIFWMACLGWTLGFLSRRFWDDWGLPALMVLAACDVDLLLQSKIHENSLKRIALGGSLVVVICLVFTSDLDSRWTRSLTWQFLKQDDPELAGWLPDKGGIFYAADPSFFYETFLKNPKADWRYILGFEMTLMPKDDFKILYRILWNNNAAQAYAPWVEKMRPQDRLFIRANSGSPPPISGLEWHYTLGGMWSGRLPRTNPPPVKTESPGNSPDQGR